MCNESNRRHQSPSAEDLRQQMQTIRQSLAPEADEIVSTAGQLTSWRYYVRTHPWASLGVAAAVGYLVVPRKLEVLKPDQEDLKKLARDSRLVLEHEPVKRRPRLVGTLFNLTGNMLLRAGMAYLGRRLGHLVSQDGAQSSETADVEQ